MQVRSDGIPFEIGLPLARPVDLRRFPNLHIVASADAPGTARVVLRSTLEAPEAAGPAVSLHGRETAFALDPQSLPERAAMLRLRFDLPAGRTLRLQDVSLELSAHAAPAPIRELPSGSVEQQLLALRREHVELPSAIVVPHGAVASMLARSDTADASAPGPSEPNWIEVGLFVALLVCARLYPPHDARARALLELVLVLAVPMWLVVGQHFSGRIDRIQIALIASTFLYAVSFAWPRNWSWNGSASAWILAIAVVVGALLIAIVLHHADAGLRPIGSGHVIRYFGWALIQQYLICVVCLERWRTLTGNIFLAVYLSALCFALLHTPNSSLMLATFAGGLCWCALYVRERALLPLAFSHAASAMLLIALLPPEVLLSAEVSARFFQ